MSTNPRPPRPPVEPPPLPAPGGTPLLPWDEQAERAVLGAVLLDPESALDPALELLRGEDFYRPAHRLIFDAFVALASENAAIDPVTVRSRLEQQGELEKAGGDAYLASLVDGLPRAGNVAAWAEIVRDHALRREVLRAAEEVREAARAAAIPAAELLDRAEKRLFELSQSGRRGGFRSIQEIGMEGLATLEELSDRRELVTGLPTGYVRLDRMTSGFQRGDLVILAARPSMGKTALALNIAQNVAIGKHAGVGIFSLEMSAEQLFFRLVAGLGRVDSRKLRTGRLNAEEWERVTHAVDALVSSPIFIDDTPGLTPMEVRSKARRLKAEHDIGLLVLDYLQLMRPEQKSDSRQQEVSEISRAMKAVAKELGIPVLCLSQLSRAPDQRTGDHRPQLSDLRDSGSIEQDADVVLFIYRPEVYEKDPQKVAEKDLEGKAEVIVAKQRNGPIGAVPLYFVKEFTRFENREDDLAPGER